LPAAGITRFTPNVNGPPTRPVTQLRLAAAGGCRGYKAEAAYSPIEIGDLLTTSRTPGHAMKATDPQQAFGAVIGKALKPLHEGIGLIPILVSLQ
jgi:hypothetical protein